MGKGMPLARIHIRQLLTGLGLLVVLLLAAAFVLGLLSLKRTSEIVSEDFQQQQLILAKTTARQMEDGLEFLRGSSGSSTIPRPFNIWRKWPGPTACRSVSTTSPNWG